MTRGRRDPMGCRRAGGWTPPLQAAGPSWLAGGRWTGEAFRIAFAEALWITPQPLQIRAPRMTRRLRLPARCRSSSSLQLGIADIRPFRAALRVTLRVRIEHT